MWRVVVDTLTFFNVRTPAVWSLDAWGLKSTLPLDTIKLFFELENDAFVDGIEVKELKGLHDNDDIKFDNVNDLQWSIEPRDDDQRSDEVESQKAIRLEMTDFCKVKCLGCQRGMGAMPQCIPAMEYKTQSSNSQFWVMWT